MKNAKNVQNWLENQNTISSLADPEAIQKKKHIPTSVRLSFCRLYVSQDEKRKTEVKLPFFLLLCYCKPKRKTENGSQTSVFSFVVLHASQNEKRKNGH